MTEVKYPTGRSLTLSSIHQSPSPSFTAISNCTFYENWKDQAENLILMFNEIGFRFNIYISKPD